MAIENMNDGVGKKIVEALKMQNADHASADVVISEDPQEIETEDLQEEQNVPQTEDYTVENYSTIDDTMFSDSQNFSEPTMPNLQNSIQPTERQMQIKSQLQYQAATQNSAPQSFIDNAFNQSLNQNLGSSYAQTQDDFEYPANVSVLKQLIAKLPAGVSKQTGALIIKQTMEALGISMGSVLQEAKQVQETLTQNSKECQNSIVEYRKQIGILETKAQNYQRQAAVMNDIINLFIQTR